MDSNTHRKTVQHFHEPGDLHELTFCFQRKPLLTNDDWRMRLARTIDEANRVERFQLIAFVFMPEHVHLLVVPQENEPDIGRYLAQVKQPFSKSINEILIQKKLPLSGQLTVQERPGKFCFRFWQEGPGYDRNLNTADSIEAALNYIHMNPVKRKLVEKAVDWCWSSTRWYLADPPRRQIEGLPFVHACRPDRWIGDQLSWLACRIRTQTACTLVWVPLATPVSGTNIGFDDFIKALHGMSIE
jgi:putative transposase